MVGSPHPQGQDNPNQQPLGLTAGADGNIWFSEGVANPTGAGYLSSGLGIVNLSELAPHAERTRQPGFGRWIAPYRIATGPDNNIWFTLPLAQKIGEVHVQSKTISTFDVTTKLQTA